MKKSNKKKFPQKSTKITTEQFTPSTENDASGCENSWNYWTGVGPQPGGIEWAPEGY